MVYTHARDTALVTCVRLGIVCTHEENRRLAFGGGRDEIEIPFFVNSMMNASATKKWGTDKRWEQIIQGISSDYTGWSRNMFTVYYRRLWETVNIATLV